MAVVRGPSPGLDAKKHFFDSFFPRSVEDPSGLEIREGERNKNSWLGGCKPFSERILHGEPAAPRRVAGVTRIRQATIFFMAYSPHLPTIAMSAATPVSFRQWAPRLAGHVTIEDYANVRCAFQVPWHQFLPRWPATPTSAACHRHPRRTCRLFSARSSPGARDPLLMA